VLRLEYQAYETLARKEGERIVQAARKRFGVEVACMHRLGLLEPGEAAGWVGAAAPHRRTAFAACAHAMDEIKRRLPVWKREHYADGEAEWVVCAHEHSVAAGAPP
jgi:molybdopterin synthase catalytic subunit